MRYRTTAVAIVMAALGGTFSPTLARAQAQPAAQPQTAASGERAVARGFDAHQRQVVLDYFRNHPNEFGESAQEQWDRQDIGAYLKVDGNFDESLKEVSRPLPSALEAQLAPLPAGWRYAMVGYNVCIIDKQSTIRDIVRSDSFDARNREAIDQWRREQPASQSTGAPATAVNNGDLDRRILIGRVIDSDLQAQAQNAPQALVSRLSPAPFDWKYVTVENRLCLVDADWRVHETFRL